MSSAVIPERRVSGVLRLKRGMKPIQPGRMKLKFSDYIDKAKLPEVPKVFGHLKAAAPPGGWGMLGNDQLGDCVMAGAAHETMLWAWATQRPIPAFTTSDVVQQYLQQTGGLDTGLDPVSTAFWRQQHGIADANGNLHKIDAFVQLQNLDELKLAVYLFGVAAFCWALPDRAEDQFAHEHAWTDMSQVPDPDAGHYTPCGGMNSAGNFEFLTWGRIQAATPAFTQKYMSPGGCIAYLSQEYMLAAGASPEAIAWQDLQNDIRTLA